MMQWLAWTHEEIVSWPLKSRAVFNQPIARVNRVRKTSDNLFRLSPVPCGTRSLHRIRLLGGGFRPMKSGCASPTPRSRSREEKDVTKPPSVSRRWYPEPQCYWALKRYPVAPFATWWRRGNALSVIRRIMSCDTVTTHSNIDDAMPTSWS